MNKVGIFNVAVAVIIEKDDKILITRRSLKRDHAPGDWEAGITGRVDQGERCEEAALREVHEEVEEALPYMTNPNVVKELKAFIEFKKHYQI
jgi:ADP-ribose pyrophosphatase YjhB (NUDIX family)